jgi:hypothetical protein
MSFGTLSATRAIRCGRAQHVRAASDLFATTVLSSLGLPASILFVGFGGRIEI